MDKLLEKLKELGNRILEWWNRFTAKQKTLIITVGAVLVLAIAIITTVLTRPHYVLLRECDNATETTEVRDLLDSESMNYQISDDGLTVRVLKSQLSEASLLLAANNIQSARYTIDNVTDGSFATTESDKQKKHVVYLQEYLAHDVLEKFTMVKSAQVTLNIPENDGTLIDSNEESYAWVLLELKDELPPESAAYMARAIATGIGNDTTNNIVIMDAEGNMLFTGEDNYTTSGTANAQLSVKAEAERLVKNEVRRVLLGTNEFDNVEVASNLVLDFSTTDTTEHQYTPADGQTQGVYSHADIYSEENTADGGGVPGTDSNDDDTTYVLEDGSNSSSTVSEESYDYLPNETITTKTTPAGLIDYGQSSLAAALIRYNVIREEDAEAQGLLDGVTWEEYKLNNTERTRIDVDEDLYATVANATGISTGSITLVAYSENVFFDAEGPNISATDVLQIILIIVILALLAFVVLRSMRSDKAAEEEEELSVESLLQSTGPQLEEIPTDDESDEKKLVNKFVDENPEAAANLLRNWLNEDWG